MIRRINIFGGPGVGKSTMAAYIYSYFKMNHYRIELVQEFVKSWAYEGKTISSFDQLYLFSRQVRMEDIALRNGVDLIVTDSPIYLSACYAMMSKFCRHESLTQLAKEFDDIYPSINLLINRGNKYDIHGRYQDEKEAIEIDSVIISYLDHNNIAYTVIKNCHDAVSTIGKGLAVYEEE